MFGGGVNRFIQASVGLHIASLPNQDTDTAGWKHFKVHPSPTMLRSHPTASTSRTTPQGLIQLTWVTKDPTGHDTLFLDLTVPLGSSAEVKLPLHVLSSRDNMSSVQSSVQVIWGKHCSLTCKVDVPEAILSHGCPEGLIHEVICINREHDKELFLLIRSAGPGQHRFRIA